MFGSSFMNSFIELPPHKDEIPELVLRSPSPFVPGYVKLHLRFHFSAFFSSAMVG